MAQHFFGLNRGANDSFPQVTVSTTDTGLEVQIVVLDGQNVSRKDAHDLAEAIIRWIDTNQSGSSTAFPI